ncbi:MAG TPA: DUF4214 domain-containing protein [Pyrinomonadaceae bacterium]|jgi:Domain of unknown function (DUF4214)
MPRLLRKSAVFASLLLLVLIALISLFERRSGAAQLHQATRPAANYTRNVGSWLNLLTQDSPNPSGDVQIVVTTSQGPNISSRVVATVANTTAITSESSSAQAPTQAVAAGDIVFSQIYGSGGNPGSTFQNNYLELFNRTNSVVNISGWPFYIATATGTFNQAISFVSSRGIGIGPHRYLLIRFGPDSTNGAPLPNPDLTAPFHFDPPPGSPPIPDLNLSPSGKVFLTTPGTSLLGTTCPLPNPEIVDFVGYGSAANCFEGSGPTATISNTTAALRKNGGFIDSDNNADDFSVRPPSPRNSSNRPIDDAEFFVRQHYSDFLNRQPDPTGLSFWIDQITSCVIDQPCIEVKRINVSAAFFLSIEFQETGYLVERVYKSAYGDGMGISTIGGTHQLTVPVVRFNEFLPDTQQLGQGVIIGQPGADEVLENNKRVFMDQFVQRPRFTTAFPVSMTAAEFVDTLNRNAGGVLSPAQRDQLVTDLSTNVKTRSQVLRAVAEDSDLFNAERNRAFVLMQYLGYLRRNPNDTPDTDYTGYDFWLTKLNQFNGNFVNAEMVKAFITSGEYRQRF